ncbi:hypothetical protein BUALT_Bualt18G0033600 [Buddleja alternifolia]|uniref:Haloacid dehalogenase superfamily protein n=1 Tax=Buddleja alternifolia TaxID=168488 RepID=A0AAV6W461_9LAMI|nr:hypothetical protein BUALT_Bualt18G0033600 [Buddleja alternifolia]
MQSTSIASWNTCYYYYPVPKSLLSHLPSSNRTTLNLNSHSNNNNNTTFTTLTTTTSTNRNRCSKEQDKKRNHYSQNTPYPDHESRKLFQEFYSSVETPRPPQFREEEEEEEGFVSSDISSNMWWADLKAALGQRINVKGITSSVGILFKDNHLIIPHVRAPDLRYVDWAEMKERGFKGVVFDKDNTITVPYSLSLWDPLGQSIQHCKSLFGEHNIAVFSNSAGLSEYDPDGGKARALEDAIGIKVIRHSVKKPAGSAEEIEKHFGCESSQLIMVGDRPFTDIVYGNRNGFFTILTEPLSLKEEPLIVRQVRLIEVTLVERWSRKGLKPISHNLIPDSVKCVKDVPLS